jgi:hypothetical protein
MNEFEAAGVHVTFGYFKRSIIPEGVVLEQHSHKYDHYSVLTAGEVLVEVDGKMSFHKAPAEIMIKAGAKHRVRAMTQVVWYCNHDIQHIPADLIDQALIE